ncbi:helitron helicase-like domain-containing protein [Artemisia annua]|uniref:Helitron helicase-like domain-containing protein n=1 Tax=Artemisia annua TaxID=35608 RepID=A0A2U1QLJ6_ARTAN|nr:helitron helicase-like domain-containing protein [Artemisia annua]
MRTKDKARRRVTSLRSLESADKCMYSQPFHSENVVTTAKRPITHVDEPSCGSPSVAKRPRNNNSVTSRNSNDKQYHNLLKESLQRFNDAGVSNGSRKRKAIEMYELPEFALPKGQGVSAEPVPTLRHTDAEEEVHPTPVVNSHNVSSCDPTTPTTVDKGKRKVSEYNSKTNYTSHKEMINSVACYPSRDGTQDLLYGTPSSLPMCSRTLVQSHQENAIPQGAFLPLLSLILYRRHSIMLFPFLPARLPSSTTRLAPMHNRSNRSTRVRQEQPTLNRRQRVRAASNTQRHRPSNTRTPVRQGPPSTYISMGRCDRVCRHCNAFFWCEERVTSSTRLHPEYNKCCNKGQVQLPTHDDYPEYIKHLFSDAHFMEHIRAYNQMFAMTSLGAEVDQSVNIGRGPYVFKISGQLYHCIGGMLPEQGKRPRFLQLYIFDTDNEVDNLLENMQRHGEGLRREIVKGLIEFLDEHNQLVQVFRTAGNKMAEADIPTFKVRLFGVVGSRQHELPSGDSIGAIVFEGGPDVESNFDVIIQQHSGTPQRINKLNPSYMSLQFPLLFIYGEDDYHLELRLTNTTNETSYAPRKMSMKMFYAYQLYDRQGQKMDEGSSIVVSAEPKGKEVVADSQDISLATLTVSDTDKSIYVKAYRKWTIANKNGKPIMFCCMLIDRQVL